VLVLDRLSALMVTLTAVLGLIVLAYASATGWDRRGRNFHALYQFQMMGLFGAMLTGDIFNLFVFFEILLIASYGLMTHGGGRMRLRGGVQYVIYNLAGSTLFLFALGTLYAVFGSLNMADLAERVLILPEGDEALVRVTAALLVLVFVLKGSLVPLHFWLPNTYALAPAPVAALFAVMTKVGAYAVIRVYTLIFPDTLDAIGGLVSDVMVPAALITLAVGMIGILGGGTLARVVSFAVIGSMGTLFLAISTFTETGIAAALYYLVHSTLAGAALFLIVDQLRARRGNSTLDTRAPMRGSGLVSALFFVAAIAAAGMPPLSGFIGKLLVLDAMRDQAWWIWGWSVVLGTSLLAVIGFSRAGSTLFWKPYDGMTPMAEDFRIAPGATSGLALAIIGGMLALIVALALLAGPATRYARSTSAQLFNSAEYIHAVLGTPAQRAARHAAEAAAADDSGGDSGHDTDHGTDGDGGPDHGADTAAEGH
ncbi:MAG: monovalent cation/H+ antiporter subunit D, partial [Pararhodobacter sp.]|nr:monovalent cation/H+ antiporter subunit D [Pararhodobacter sp.]